MSVGVFRLLTNLARAAGVHRDKDVCFVAACPRASWRDPPASLTTRQHHYAISRWLDQQERVFTWLSEKLPSEPPVLAHGHLEGMLASA
jgi:hypothetical protein